MQWQVPLFDPDLGEAEIAALTAVIRSKWLTQGEQTERFERTFAGFVGSEYGVALNSATAALHLALMAHGVGPRDEVICPSLTFVATANAIRYCGAQPIFADVDSADCWNISATGIEACITPATRAVIVVHYAGHMCDMPAIMALAARHGLKVIEDVAHAPGATLAGRAAGNWGDAGCFSFFSNKNMTTAEGGMLTTNHEAVAKAAQRLRCHGMTSVTLDRHKGHNFSYDVTDLGYNYRMSELNACIGLVQLEHLAERNQKRAMLSTYYRRKLNARGLVAVPFEKPLGTGSFHIFPVLLPAHVERGTVMAGLRDQGIQSSIHYRPIHTFTNFVDNGSARHPLPLTDMIGARELTLPLYPSMSEPQVDLVCDTLHSLIGG